MTEENTGTYEEAPQIPELFYELGAKMKKYSLWMWIILGTGLVCGFFILVAGIVWGIVQDDIAMIVFFSVLGLFGLIFSCIGIISLVMYWQYLGSVKNIRDATADPIFEKVYQYLLIGFILQFCGLAIVTFILNILVFMELEKWALKMEQLLPTPEMKNISEGYKWMKIATAVSICCGLAIIAMPVAYSKVGKAYMAEYNSSKFGGFGVTQQYPL
ncbi:hypothetical protein DSAG12_01036 [Promethearchaeum syntrophicum]|uniref:Uncharacterized protein n=1 Tax=Promethearchaeum syntrophicum TaxID=2594042 RepID=A0A5B9D7X9_9ARCH|nr:hypothetical protein [Candidatus Prometheoarchaeum syntrophicum]QEE15212.1 hypothetical protein DSAG12_01036 [Candidatus Prometheoarchaeum syntrophicum]